jgi:hypothetical protein
VTLFLLSPADVGGKRAQILLNERADFPLAHRLRSDGAPLGEVFSFLSGLYFRGKLAYATRFAAAPNDQVRVITTNRGLLPIGTPIRPDDLRDFGTVEIAAQDLIFRRSLEPDLRALPPGRVVLLGSIATPKYLTVLLEVLGDRLYYPTLFLGIGDMSRGALLLRAARSGAELEYLPAGELPVLRKRRG